MSNFWETEIDNSTAPSEWNAIYTIQLGELIEMGVFKWSLPILDWSDSAIDMEQYDRLCDYFIERFRYREISIEPFQEWARCLKRKLQYEIMPKYGPLYERFSAGLNPLQEKSEYEKKREIDSEYPETLLSGNSDYISSGKDSEYDKGYEGNIVDQSQRYKESFQGIDEMICDELESLFISLYTMNINGI